MDAVNKFFLSQIKRTDGTLEKGIVVKDTAEAAMQSLHAYLGAYAYGGNAKTDYVQVSVVDSNGVYVVTPVVWQKAEEQTPTPEA